MKMDSEHKEFLTPKREDENSELDIDDEYKIFLDHLREDSYSYVFEKSPVRVKYEEEGEPCNGNVTETQNNSVIDSRRRRHATGKERSTNSQFERDIFLFNALKHKNRGRTAIDICYEEFLRNVKVRSNSMSLKLNNGVTIKYSEEIESPNASRTPKATRFPNGESKMHDGSLMRSATSIPMFEGYATFTGASRSSKMSCFEEGLMSLCNKPFDQAEYEDLLLKVSTREPKMRDRHLRRGTKSYSTKEMAKSYFDFHPGFAEQIRASCCPNHHLKQLRGFIFWLKNLCHEGAFRPWEDERFKLCDNC